MPHMVFRLSEFPGLSELKPNQEAEITLRGRVVMVGSALDDVSVHVEVSDAQAKSASSDSTSDILKELFEQTKTDRNGIQFVNPIHSPVGGSA